MTSEIHTITEAEFVRQVTPSILDLSDEVEDNQDEEVVKKIYLAFKVTQSYCPFQSGGEKMRESNERLRNCMQNFY